MKNNLNEQKSYRISKVWAVAETFRNCSTIALIFFVLVASVIAFQAPQSAQINLNSTLQTVIGDDVVSYIMIIVTISSLVYLDLVVKTNLYSHTERPSMYSKVIKQASHAIFYPLIFELLSMFMGDLCKSVIATIILMAFFIFIILNGIFVTAMINYIISEITAD